MQFVIDMEVTNRCNAKCHFCPRDRTPHQGLMPAEVFEAGLQRAIEYRSAIAEPAGDKVRVSLCGLGEPLLNRRAVDYCRQARAEGFSVVMSSNGSLLDERRSTELLEAGLQQILVNVGEEGDDYEEIYQLPFERTLENVVRFNEMSGGACEVVVVLVDHRGDPAHIDRMRRYWADHGIQQAVSYGIMNRGGSLFVDHMQYGDYRGLAEARGPGSPPGGHAPLRSTFGYLFVGYDGQYYLCCSDWEKQAPLGSVFDKSFVDVAQAKLDLVVSRDPCAAPATWTRSTVSPRSCGPRPAGSCRRVGRRGGGQDRRRQRGRRGRPAPAGPRGAGRAAHPAAHPGAGRCSRVPEPCPNGSHRVAARGRAPLPLGSAVRHAVRYIAGAMGRDTGGAGDGRRRPRDGRRDFLRKAAVAGTTAFAVPMIVTVDPAGAQAVTSPPPEPPGSSVPVTLRRGAWTSHPVASRRPAAPPHAAAELPRTGANLDRLVAAGLAATAGGAALVLWSADRKANPKPTFDAPEPPDPEAAT